VPSGYEFPRVPLLKEMFFAATPPLVTKQARGEGPQEVRLPQASASSREMRQRLKEGFPRIIVGH
jgi:hypothetical protein